jgi:hypothetical protein
MREPQTAVKLLGQFDGTLPIDFLLKRDIPPACRSTTVVLRIDAGPTLHKQPQHRLVR